MLLAYYGDDFTGSTDVLEALSTGGIEAVLFVGPPSDEMLRRYSHVRAIGIAGNSRTMSPQEMDRTLPDLFRAILKIEPRIVHYKTCSTFDSSPEIGSIGRAIDIGFEVFQNRMVPMVVGAPPLRRYCVFGNLFAQSGLNSEPYRLDRHPSMRHHPVTPMTEADLRVHLSKQTSRPIELVDVLTLNNGYEAVRDALGRIRQLGSVVLFDTLTDDHLTLIGRVIADTQQREQAPLFVAGSSGVDYALARHWQNADVAMTPPKRLHLPVIDPVDRALVISGSCSPVTHRQIGWAFEHGFAEVAIDPSELCEVEQPNARICELAKRIQSSLDAGRSVIAHTNRGTAVDVNVDRKLGTRLGCVLREALRARSVQRVAVVGGDTSSQVARSLEIEAVEMIGPLEPGAPLCVVRSRDNAVDGVQMVFKGGQVGYDDFFGTLLRGRSNQLAIGATK